MGYLIPRQDIAPDQELRYTSAPPIMKHLYTGLWRSYYHFGVPEAATHIGYPKLQNSVVTKDLVLLQTNLHPIRPWRPGYISSNVVADLAAKMPSSKGG